MHICLTFATKKRKIAIAETLFQKKKTGYIAVCQHSVYKQYLLKRHRALLNLSITHVASDAIVRAKSPLQVF